MKINIIALVILIAVSLVVDRYISNVIRRRVGKRWLLMLHRAISTVAMVSLVPVFITDIRSSSNEFFVIQMWMMMTFLSVSLSQIFFVIVDLISRIPQKFGKKRIKWLSYAGGAIGIIGFISVWWGALFNRFDIEVKEVSVEIENLPESFDGYTIAQISDLHVGTYLNDTTFVSEVVDRVNALNPDVIAFTGDIVNRHSTEIKPFVPVLQRLKAKDAKFAIRGNHDYSGYYRFNDDLMRWYDSEELLQSIIESGFDLLKNRYESIHRGNDSIVFIGVGNISGKPKEYHPYLEMAYPDRNDSAVKILLSHNPDHWATYLADNPDNNIALTLSGHTHAMQMKFGRFSPSALMKKYWAGLYHDKEGKRQIYINIGTGAVGMPSRIGANPEITLITLHRKTD